MKTLKVGIIGAGWIAHKMAQALAPLQEAKVYAIASRSLDKAQAFADEYGIEKAYGSYEALVADEAVDLVYIATPHSHHYPHTRLALEHGKPCLVEKAFMANAAETEAILTLAHEKKLFVTEAIWTRYMPLSHKVKELMEVSDKIVQDAIDDPSDVPQIKKFLDYYLPTTIKLLNAYDRMGAQGIEGGNIGKTMSSINEMLDTAIEAYKKLLDSLFADQAMDIETDIDVMNTLLKREGFSAAGEGGLKF